MRAWKLVEPQSGSPDMVFTANAGLVHRGVVALSSFLHPERQGEELHFRKWFDDCGFCVCQIPRSTPFEGEGERRCSKWTARVYGRDMEFGPGNPVIAN